MAGFVECKLSVDELLWNLLALFPHLQNEPFSRVVVVVRPVLIRVNLDELLFLDRLVPQCQLVLTIRACLLKRVATAACFVVQLLFKTWTRESKSGVRYVQVRTLGFLSEGIIDFRGLEEGEKQLESNHTDKCVGSE